ncbi:7-deoxyloganetin glucosyltransferase-like [Daucus carota subsp. sativus]|uniref:7-deoxyloganetin glucosyltransferase-like n=1 Tax=Daucus carota subsp. sativus TaxID=79200 RepID=UPI0007EFC97D|nr:PREDICTED: 7-deoxyloganetin glucosyltransferase-like [Daucus carota subsp. sativus]XP_017222232.1 PREDICTED: 7-deoxyloganetin glucosyltransferase-like [Daucus carota subsp. sativus]
MDSSTKAGEKQGHVVCIPYPAQGHIKAMLKMAKLLNSKGLSITFVNTEFNHKRFLKSGGLENIESLPSFRFEAIPDGLPPSDADATQDIPELCRAIIENDMLPAFQNLLAKLNAGTHQVTSILSDGFMPFTADAAQSLGIPIVLMWTISACGFMGFYQFKNALERGIIPLKDASYLTNGYLDTIIDWIPGIPEIRLGDLPSHIRITDPNDFVFNFIVNSTQRATNGTANVLHTFDDLEEELVNAISSMFTTVYAIGPQQMLLNQIPSDQTERLKSIGYSLWKEETKCLEWLDSKEADSVVYVNFGSITVMSAEQLMEFGWGLANSNCSFIWIIRPDLIMGESTVTLGVEFLEAIKNRGLISGWCPQEDVLNHAAVGGFLTHGGWNSTIESISAGVPMLCWPFFGDQTINCKYMCDWECGMEIRNDCTRDDVEKLVRLLMDGVEGKKMRNKALEWKGMAEKACASDGSSSNNLDKLVLHLKN